MTKGRIPQTPGGIINAKARETVSCPECQRPVGKPCRAQSGTNRWYSHPDRLRLAREVLAHPDRYTVSENGITLFHVGRVLDTEASPVIDADEYVRRINEPRKQRIDTLEGGLRLAHHMLGTDAFLSRLAVTMVEMNVDAHWLAALPTAQTEIRVVHDASRE